MDFFRWARGIFTRLRDTTATDTHESSTQDAIPGLPDHLVVAHILRSEYFDDPADLARLPAVGSAMRDTVAETGLEFEELDEDEAVLLGCLHAVQGLQRRGRLRRQELLCEAAARSGQLEELKVLRNYGCPWNAATCWGAARGGISRCCSGRARMGAIETQACARWRRRADISKCCSGRTRTGARGTW